MKMLLVWLPIFMQFSFPTPSWPQIQTPTPYQTPTPVATVSDEVVVGVEEMLATLTAIPTDQPQLEGNGSQLTYNNQPLLPELEARDLFGYVKWILSNGAESVFGPLAPLLVHFGFLFVATIIWLFVYIWNQYLNTLFQAVQWIVGKVLEVFAAIK